MSSESGQGVRLATERIALVETTVTHQLLWAVRRSRGFGLALYSLVGILLSYRFERWPGGGLRYVLRRDVRLGPDGTKIAVGWTPRGTRGWTWGNWIILSPDAAIEGREYELTLIHEYVHVLQYRTNGLWFIPRYLRGGLWNWERNPYEVQACAVEAQYRAAPELPPLWALQLHSV